MIDTALKCVAAALSLIAFHLIMDGVLPKRTLPVAAAEHHGPPSPFERRENTGFLTVPIPPKTCPEQWIEQSPPRRRSCVAVHLSVNKEQPQ